MARLRQVVTLDEFHDEGARPPDGFTAVDVREVWMVQRRKGLRFACEASEPFSVVCQRVR